MSDAAPTVLVVDDDDTVRSFAALALARLGARVLEAPGGDVALELYRRHVGQIDLVLLDVNMPGRSGPEVLAELRQINPGVRYCFATGGGSVAVPPGEDFLRKPLSLADLQGVLRRLVGWP